MPVLRVDAVGDVPERHGGGTLERDLTQALRATPPGSPVAILVHGFKFCPFHPGFNPHRHIFALDPPATCRKALSWPTALGFTSPEPQAGLCLPFGWSARGSIWRAWHQALSAGRALAKLLDTVAAQRDGPVDIIAHSLGARVALTALAETKSPVGRVILMAGAEFCATAATAMVQPEARGAEVFNVISRANDPYDALVEWLMPAPEAGDRVLGAAPRIPGWLNLQIDDPATRDALAPFGAVIAPARTRLCHWSSYLRPGLMPFYGALLRERERLGMAQLRACLPESATTRWGRLLPAISRSAQPPHAAQG
ncbi:MAG: alpha/beta fold hydrolase [Pseudomonadota bacterium]